MTHRRTLTPKARTALWHAQDKCCAECQCPTNLGVMCADHKAPLWTTADNGDDNFQLLCRRCHATKTKREASVRGKTKRLEKQRLEGRKPKVSKIESRGFDTRLWRHMSGKVEVRT